MIRKVALGLVLACALHGAGWAQTANCVPETGDPTAPVETVRWFLRDLGNHNFEGAGALVARDAAFFDSESREAITADGFLRQMAEDSAGEPQASITIVSQLTVGEAVAVRARTAGGGDVGEAIVGFTVSRGCITSGAFLLTD